MAVLVNTQSVIALDGELKRRPGLPDLSHGKYFLLPQVQTAFSAFVIDDDNDSLGRFVDVS